MISTSISLGRHLEEPAARARQARLRLDRDPDRLPRVRVHLLRARRQPVRLRADRALRHEEAEQRLETLLALPVSRVRWLGGRLLLALGAAIAISLAGGFFTWAGAESGGVGISLARMLEAGANCLPVGLLFLGIAALAYALVPRASAGIAYGLVTVAFLWYLVGSLLGVPKWLVDATPFAHVGLVPAQSFRTLAAVVMVAIGALASAAALAVFRRRDLLGA